MTRPNLIHINPVECHHYSFMISLDKWNGNCNPSDDLSTQICFLGDKKVVNSKVFKMIKRINKVKILGKHISCGCKCKLDSTA